MTEKIGSMWASTPTEGRGHCAVMQLMIEGETYKYMRGRNFCGSENQLSRQGNSSFDGTGACLLLCFYDRKGETQNYPGIFRSLSGEGGKNDDKLTDKKGG